MALNIKWSAEAEKTFLGILTHLEKNWSQKETLNFIARTETLLDSIAREPYLFKASKKQSIRKAFVTKHNALFYRVSNTHIYLLSFWDNRQSPAKNKY